MNQKTLSISPGSLFMENEWLDLSYINDKVIMHGQIVAKKQYDLTGETEVEQILTKEQVREVEDLMFRHRRELLTLMKGYVNGI